MTNNCYNGCKYRNGYRDHRTPAEWRRDCQLEVAAAEGQRESAQRLRREAERLIDRANESAIKKEQELGHRSEVKIKDVQYKCAEIERQKAALDEEIALLLGYQKRVEDANESLIGDSLDVIAECLRLRNCRQGVDLVFDDVEKELLRERELIYGIKEQLVGLLDKVVLQIRRLRAFVYNLTVDLQYKQKTLKIEEHNGKLDKNHIDTSVLSGDKNVFKPAQISFIEWDRFTGDIVLEANNVLSNGRPIRAYFDKCLTKMFEDLVTQSKAVDQAFRLRVDEYKEVIDKLNKQRAETGKRVDEVQSTISELKASVDENEKLTSVAHTRLLNRTRREGVELCRDEVEAELYAEVSALEDDARCLRAALADSTECLRRLKQSAVRLDGQLEVKRDSLRLDGQLCADQRKRVDFRAF